MERFRQFAKREHKIDIAPLKKGEDITEWSGKEQLIQEDFIWGVGPEALYQISRVEYKMEPDSIKIKDLIRLFPEYYLPKRNTYHNRGDFFWAKQTEEETPEEFWRRLIEIEKQCNFNTKSAEELLISKYMTTITDKKLRDKMMKEKTLEMKKTIELIKQNTYEKKNKKNTIPEALIYTKERHIIKEEPIQRMERFGTRPKTKITRKMIMQILRSTELDTITQMPSTRNRPVPNAEEKDITQKYADKSTSTTEQ